MRINATSVQGKRFQIIEEYVQYSTQETPQEIMDLLQASGATVSTFVIEGIDPILIGSTSGFPLAFDRCKKVPLVFEGEILDQPKRNRNYFNRFEDRFYEMVRQLHQQANVRLTYLSLGQGLTEAEIEALEAKAGKKIPAAVKEFYQIFGHVIFLWEFKKPYTSKETLLGSNSYCLHSGQHQGSIHIMPLQQVLLEDWKEEEHHFPEGTDLRIFDYFSMYHMMAFEMGDSDDPQLYLGEDHGAGFDPIQPTFSAYVNALVGIYGYLNRFQHMEFWTTDESDSLLEERNWKLAASQFVSFDFTNRHAIKEYVRETWERIEGGIEREAWDEVYNIASAFYEYDIKANGTVLDILTIRENEEEYFEWLGYAIEDGFDLDAYEVETQFKTFMQTERYKALKTSM